MWVSKPPHLTPPPPPHQTSIPIELPLNSSSFFSYCGVDVREGERRVKKLQELSCVCGYDGERERERKNICRCQNSSLGLFSTEKTQIVADLYVDEPNSKDLKKCLQNLFLKENTCNFCMYVMYGCYSA